MVVLGWWWRWLGRTSASAQLSLPLDRSDPFEGQELNGVCQAKEKVKCTTTGTTTGTTKCTTVYYMHY